MTTGRRGSWRAVLAADTAAGPRPPCKPQVPRAGTCFSLNLYSQLARLCSGRGHAAGGGTALHGPHGACSTGSQSVTSYLRCLPRSLMPSPRVPLSRGPEHVFFLSVFFCFFKLDYNPTVCFCGEHPSGVLVKHDTCGRSRAPCSSPTRDGLPVQPRRPSQGLLRMERMQPLPLPCCTRPTLLCTHAHLTQLTRPHPCSLHLPSSFRQMFFAACVRSLCHLLLEAFPD